MGRPHSAVFVVKCRKFKPTSRHSVPVKFRGAKMLASRVSLEHAARIAESFNRARLADGKGRQKRWAIAVADPVSLVGLHLAANAKRATAARKEGGGSNA